MSHHPMITIITVNLNNLEGLKKTISSVLEQSLQEFEYIIIDGGSTDGSREFIEENSENIKYWVSEKDRGIYNAMNKGIKIAKGEYILFLNSGDWLYNKNILKSMVGNFQGCDVLYGNMIKVFPDGREILDKGVNGGEISLSTFIDGNLNHQATFIRKDLFYLYGLYDENLKIVSDWKLFLIALGLNNSKVKYIDHVISCFDMTGLSSNYNDRDAERLKVIKELIPTPLYNDYLILKEYKRAAGSSRVRKFLKTEQNIITRKLHSIIFRLFT